MFKFKKQYILSNEICELSPLKKGHEKELHEQANNENIWIHFEENGYGKKNFHQYMQRALQQSTEEKQYPFVIKDVRSNKYVGMTRIYDINNTFGNVKLGHTWIGEDFQGTGLNTNAKYLLFSFLFDELKMQRIGFGASSENHRSINAMKSVGCIHEGILRSFIPMPMSDKRIDIVLMSILYDEWNERIRHTLKDKISSKKT